MSIETSVRCDHRTPAPPCTERIVMAVPATMTRAISGELRRAGWSELRTGHHYCPTHRHRRGRIADGQ